MSIFAMIVLVVALVAVPVLYVYAAQQHELEYVKQDLRYLQSKK